jgi:hypothetical protein
MVAAQVRGGEDSAGRTVTAANDEKAGMDDGAIAARGLDPFEQTGNRQLWALTPFSVSMPGGLRARKLK